MGTGALLEEHRRALPALCQAAQMGSPDSPREDRVNRARGGIVLFPEGRWEVVPIMSHSPLVRPPAHVCVCVQWCWPECWGGILTARSTLCSSMLTHSGASMLVGEISTLVHGDRRSPVVGLHWSLVSSPKKIQFVEGWSGVLVFLPLLVLKL